MTIGTRIKNKRTSLNMTLEEVAKIVGTTRLTIQKYESGVIEGIPSDKVELLAKALHTTPSYLMGWDDDKNDDLPDSFPSGIAPIKKFRVPLLGEIACGEPVFAQEDFEGFLDSEVQADFALRCSGDSMIGARIMDGDIVLIRKQDMVENGEIAAVIIENEATLKRVYYYPKDGKLILNPENPAYAPLVYVGEELNQIRILGKAVIFYSRVK